MKVLHLNNPFDAPVYHEGTVSSTFDVARAFADQGLPHGTVIVADFQEAGRGRLKRPWSADRGKNLLFTILLRYGDFSSIPEALTLRVGLAVSLAVEDFVPALSDKVKIKWPNDVMIGPRKVAGILAEGDGNKMFIGVGVNVRQEEFPEEYRSKAISLIQVFPGLNEDDRFILLEKILLHLHWEIEKSPGAVLGNGGVSQGHWRESLLGRLYKKGEMVTFVEGAAESANLSVNLIEGILSGIGSGGELLIIPKGEGKERAFVNGELRVW